MKPLKAVIAIAFGLFAASSQAFWWLTQQPVNANQNQSIPHPANPNHNPWLNYPATYGGASPVHNHGNDLKPDVLANIDRYMKLDQSGRDAYAQKAQQDSLKRGSELFASTSLGKTGLNCQACHPGGKSAGGNVGVGDHDIPIPSLLGVSKRFPRFKASDDRVITQTDMQNNCIVMFLKGEPLAGGSREAADLTYYVGSFGD